MTGRKCALIIKHAPNSCVRLLTSHYGITLQPASRHGLTGLYLGHWPNQLWWLLASFPVPSRKLALSILVLMKRQIAYSIVAVVGDLQSAVCTIG